MNDKKEITIMVCGVAGVGKTVISKNIENFLASRGLNVERIISDETEEWVEQRRPLNELFGLLSSNLKITIKDVQVSRLS